MKKRYTVDDLSEQFQAIYNSITFNPDVSNIDEDEEEEINPYDEEDKEDEDEKEESLFVVYLYEKSILKRKLSDLISIYKSDVYNDEFSIAIGKMGGKLGGLKRKFIQNCKIFVIHKLFPNANFSGNMMIRISETLFGKGINKSFLCDCGYNLGSDALFNGKSDIPDIPDVMIEQCKILITLLKRIS